MASEISRTLRAYREALEESRGRYESLYTSRGQNALEFYHRYAHRLIRPYARTFADVASRRRLHRQIQRLFGTDTLDFVAVDGSCNKDVPYDGMLVSLAQLYSRKGSLSRIGEKQEGLFDIRRELRLPKHLLLFGDCGAFSYVTDSVPPFSPTEAAALYQQCGFDVGASVDHIPIETVIATDDNGAIVRRKLSESTRRRRMQLTTANAHEFLRVCKRREYSFVPVGVIQGLSANSYIQSVHDYLDMGYEHIALGGLVPRSDAEILEIVAAVRRSIQNRTRGHDRNVWLHLFGILRPKLQASFRDLGVSSFDSASYFRKAWLRSDQNYLDAGGRQWYGTIRVPISSSKPRCRLPPGRRV